MKNISRRILVAFLFACLSAISFSPAAAINVSNPTGTSTPTNTPNLYDSAVCELNSTCGSAATRGNGAAVVASGCDQTTGEFCGAQAAPGFNAAPVYAWGHCRYVTNQTNLPIFVPFGNTNDWKAFWTAFMNNAQNSIAVLQDCSLPASFTIAPDASCTSPTFTASPFSKSNVAVLGYAPWSQGNYVTQNVTVEYACKSTSGTTWNEYESVVFMGLDSEVANPSWAEGVPICSTVPPTADNYPVSCVTQNTPPIVTLTASAPTVDLGLPVNLTWIVQNANTCTANASNQEVDWKGAKTAVGTSAQAVDPTGSTTSYTLACSGSGGTTTQTVSVNTTTPPPIVTPTLPVPPATTTCSASNPVVGSFQSNSSYVIQGTGNDYNLVGSSGTVVMSGTNHSADITGDNDTLLVSGDSDCLQLNGSNQKIIISGGSHKLGMIGSGAALNISGADDKITLDLSKGNNVSLLISGINININIIGSGYTIIGNSGSGNTVNGVPLG